MVGRVTRQRCRGKGRLRPKSIDPLVVERRCSSPNYTRNLSFIWSDSCFSTKSNIWPSCLWFDAPEIAYHIYRGHVTLEVFLRRRQLDIRDAICGFRDIVACETHKCIISYFFYCMSYNMIYNINTFIITQKKTPPRIWIDAWCTTAGWENVLLRRPSSTGSPVGPRVPTGAAAALPPDAVWLDTATSFNNKQ